MSVALSLAEGQGAQRLNPNQFKWVRQITARESYYEGGWGCGKTHALAQKALFLSHLNGPDRAGMIVTLTGPLLKTVIIPELEKVLRQWGAVWHHHVSDGCITWDGGGPIWLRTAEHPKRLEGATLAWTIADECGQTTEDFRTRLAGRVRGIHPCKHRGWVGRPEGKATWFNAEIQEIISSLRPRRFWVRGKMTDNRRNLGEDYIEDILDVTDGDPTMRRQVMDGEAADAVGNIYGEISDDNVKECLNPERGAIRLGADFNVGHQVWPGATFYPAANRLHIWGEFVTTEKIVTQQKNHPGVWKCGPEGALTLTHASNVAEAIQRKGYAVRDGNQLVDVTRNVVTVYPDASGRHREASSEMSDHAMVRAVGFQLRADASNPHVPDRIAAVRLAFKRKQLLICPKGAPLTLMAFRQHARDKYGDPQKNFPEKQLELDHYCDAAGYLVWGHFPLRRLAERVQTRSY